MEASGAAAATINGRIRVCKPFFKFLYLDGKITENVAAGLKPIQSPKQFLHTFTAEQIARLLNQPGRNTDKSPDILDLEWQQQFILDSPITRAGKTSSKRPM